MAEPLVIAYYVTGHGLGHATRSIEVCKHLLQAGHSVTLVSGVPAAFFHRELPPERVSVRAVVLDSGAQQSDPFTADPEASLAAYAAVAGGAQREAALSAEAAWLAASGVQLVVSDVVPLACAAAAAACLPSACVSNFSWDFVYAEYLTATRGGSTGTATGAGDGTAAGSTAAGGGGAHFRDLVWQIARDYASATRLLRLPGYVPMPAFRDVADVPLVVRPARRSREQVFADLGLDPESRLVVFMYGGQPPGDWRLADVELPPGWTCVVCSGGQPPAGGPLPPSFRLAPDDCYTPDLVGAAHAVLGKIGYGTASECLATCTPLVFLRRQHFNEEAFLRKRLELAGGAVEMSAADFRAGRWAPYLEAAAELRPEYSEPTNGAEVVAGLLEQTARDWAVGGGAGAAAQAAAASGVARLRDTIVWGYMMQRHEDRESAEVPDWYTTGHPPGTRPTTPTISVGAEGQAEYHLDGFRVVSACVDLRAFPDTRAFVATLGMLGAGAAPDGAALLPERRAAQELFRWEDEVIVTRAPGRLDVMGGIADYSGSLVLQMPLGEACHVALQRQPAGSQRPWRGVRGGGSAASASSGAGGSPASSAPPSPSTRRGVPPALRVVSFNADATNRGPAFELDISELVGPSGEPIAYEDARELFRRDPARSWAAYVAGALVVLMRERGARFADGLSILISSDVPDGKGVSSSAAVEVATMSAVAAAYGIPLEGRELAILCQKVENLVVGAPCGIMDQMSSALGEEGRLLALLCQPAEVQRAVKVPRHARFWGVDSGIRHSVGGSDYGAVRVGAFMGLRIASQLAEEDARARGGAASSTPVGGGYLANVPPSEFGLKYERRLPESLAGAEFLEQYGSHLDATTTVDPGQRYAVRVPAAHPVHESHRVQAFRQVLQAQPGGAAQLEVLGELMLQSHASYGACGLGSGGTDRLVALALEERDAAAAAGQEPPLFGAKITGGGCGGTVCILGLGDQRGEDALARVVRRYREETGHEPKVFRGSSAGSSAFGHVRLLRERA